jgi:hypothetical protein
MTTPLALLLAFSLQADCRAQLDWAADFASRNYAGFADKVNAGTRAPYDSLLGALRADAARAATDVACDAVLRRWTAFFRDGHLTVTRQAPQAAQAAASSDDEIRARFASWDRAAIDEGGVRARLTSGPRDAVEGIWESLDGRYRVAVLRDDAEGRAFTMAIVAADSVWWTPGQVKGRLTRAVHRCSEWSRM